MLIGWCSWSQRAARVSPRVNVKVTPQPGRMSSHLPITIQRFPSPNAISRGGVPARPRPIRGRGIAAGVAPRGNARVPHHPGRIRPHPRSRNPATPRQIRRTEDVYVGSLSRYRTARCENPNHTGRSLIGWGSWGPCHPVKIGPHPRITNPSIILQLQQTEDENDGSPGSTPPCTVWNPQPTGSLLIGWGS